jgi:hypothetical protein
MFWKCFLTVWSQSQKFWGDNGIPKTTMPRLFYGMPFFSSFTSFGEAVPLLCLRVSRWGYPSTDREKQCCQKKYIYNYVLLLLPMIDKWDYFKVIFSNLLNVNSSPTQNWYWGERKFSSICCKISPNHSLIIYDFSVK